MGWQEDPPPGDNVYIADLPGDVDDHMIDLVFGSYGSIVSCKCMQAKHDGQKGAALVRFSSPEEAQWVVENCNDKTVEGLEEPVRVRYANQRREEKGSSKGGSGKARGSEVPPWHDTESEQPTPRHRPGPYDGGKAALPSDDGKGKGGSKGKDKGKDKGKSREKGTAKRPPVSSSDVHSVVRQLCKSNALPGGRQPDEHCLYITGLPYNTTELELFRLFAPFGPIPAQGVYVKLNNDGSCTGVGFVDFLDAQCAKEALAVLGGMILPDGTALHIETKRPKGAQQQRGKGRSDEVEVEPEDPF